MSQAGERGKTAKGGWPGRLVPGAAALVLALVAGSLTGCNSLKKNDDYDPLVGPGPKGLKADATTTRAKSPVPPIPPPASTSNAALAVGDPLTGGRPLAIADQRGVTGAESWQGTGQTSGGGPAGVQTASGTILSRPEPLTTPVPQVQAVPAVPAVQAVPANPVAPPAGNPPPGTYDLLQEQLKARGVTSQRVEITPAGAHVVCIVPNVNNPNLQRIFEATGPDPASALRAVIVQIDGTR
jgi:hypothetical protein